MKVCCFNRLLGSISGVHDKFFNTLLELELDMIWYRIICSGFCLKEWSIGSIHMYARGENVIQISYVCNTTYVDTSFVFLIVLILFNN